ncbi:MAG: hypothetical protein WD425_10620 [Nitrospirales bacterium]
MKPYQRFAKVFTRLLGCNTRLRLTVNGYLHVSVEDIGQFAEDNRLIAISHTGEQNCELMRDPEMVFEILARTWCTTRSRKSAAKISRKLGCLRRNFKIQAPCLPSIKLDPQISLPSFTLNSLLNFNVLKVNGVQEPG